MGRFENLVAEIFCIIKPTGTLRCILIFWILYCSGVIHGQLYCINYSSQDGLPNDYVTAVNEDDLGFVWIGTASGLVQFDGANFVKKGWIGSGDIPKEVFVKEILFDSLQNLWISTERNGIYHQNQKTSVWTNFSTQKKQNRHISSNEISDIEFFNGKLYYGCSGSGISYIDIHTLETWRADLLNQSHITRYKSDHFNNRLFIGTRNSIFSLFDQSSGFRLDTLIYSLAGLNLFDLNIDEKNNLWITDYEDGIFLFDPSNGKLLDKNPFDSRDKRQYRHLFGVGGEEWLMMPNVGIAHKSEANNWQLHTPQPFDLHSLPKATFTNIFKDMKGAIWVTSSKGISCIHPDYQAFELIPSKKDYTEYLMEAKFDQNSKRYVFSYASPEDRIKIFDDKFNLLTSLNHEVKDKRMLSIFDLLPYNNGYLGLGNFIYYIDPIAEKISEAPLEGLPKTISPRAAILSENDFWIYTIDYRLIQYSITQKKIVKEIDLSIFNERPYPFYITHGIEDFGDFIGIAAQSVFALISKNNGSIHLYDLDSDPAKISKISSHPDIPGTITQSLYLGNGQFYLLSKGEGLHKVILNPKTMDISITHTLTSDQLYSPVEMVPDERENLWIATDNGLALASENLQLLKKITSAHGLKNSKLVQGLSLVKDKIILNGEYGIILGDTSILAKIYQPASVIISRAKLSDIDLLHSENASFDHSQNNLTINISTPIYANRESYTYAYRLINHFDEWTHQELKFNAIHYDNLPPGSYTFEVKTLVNDKEGKTSSLTFKINPPFWRTWWFLAICIMAISALLYLLYQYRLKRKLAEERLNTQLAELKNEAIRAQLNPHFIFNALNSIRSMILLDKKEESIEYLGHFSSMVRDILSLSKEKNIPLAKEIEFNENYIKIEQLRFTQDFTYSISVGNNIDIHKTKVPAMLLQPFIENAIWHGLLHKDGDAELRINIEKEKNLLILKVEDNGIGRAAAQQLKANSHSKTRKGYGQILSRQRVKTLGEKAEIYIEDKIANGLASGTLVIIKIPIVYD